MTQIDENRENRHAVIRAYVLLGVLLLVYPALVGYRAVTNWIGPEMVTYDSCDFRVEKLNSYGDIKTIRPVDDHGVLDETCPNKRQAAREKETLSNLPYKALVKELRERSKPNQ